MKIEEQQLKAFLLDSELVKKEDIKKAETEAKKSGKKIDDVLLAWGKINEEELARLKAYILGIPFVNLEGEKIDAKVLAVIPEPIAKKHNIVSFKKNGSNLEVAMLDPEDLVTIEFIKKTADFKIFPRLTNVASMKYVLSQYQKSLAAEFGEIIKVDSETLATVLKEPGDEVDVEDLTKHKMDSEEIHISQEVSIRFSDFHNQC